MGKPKQVIIFVSLLILRSVLAFGLEENFALCPSGDMTGKLEKLQIYFEAQMYQEAGELLDELISQFPNEPRFEYLQAIVDYQRQDYDRAQKVFTEFIAQYPEEAEPYYLLGEIWLKKKDKAKAREYLIKYCALVPEDDDAQAKLKTIFVDDAAGVAIIKGGQENTQLVKKMGCYGGCVAVQEVQNLKLINGRSCNWSSLGIDFAFPVSLQDKQIVLKLKGKQGGEKLELTFRDKSSTGHNPQLVIAPEEQLSGDWQDIKVILSAQRTKIDLSSVIHMGLEFGTDTVQNPPNSAVFVQDIIIEPISNN